MQQTRAINRYGRRGVWVRRNGREQYIESENPSEEFMKLVNMSRKDAVIYIANRFKENILKNNAFNPQRENTDYFDLASMWNITVQELFTFFTDGLRINLIQHKMNENQYVIYQLSKETTKDYVERRRLMDIKKNSDMIEKAYYSPYVIWRVLAFYCKYYSFHMAKRVYKKILDAHHKKRYTRMKELLYPFFLNRKFNKVVCKIVENKGLSESGKILYLGEIDTRESKNPAPNVLAYTSLIPKNITVEVSNQLEIGKSYLVGLEKPYILKSNEVIQEVNM